MPKKSYSLFNNSRFYILMFALLLSVVIASWLRINITTDQLYYIRLQQTYGLVSIAFWYFALVISPLGYVVGKSRMKPIEFARRAIGVSAAYYAMLHIIVAVYGQLGGVGKLGLLPEIFTYSLGAGLAGVIVLLLLAVTSFDKVITFMSFRRWKWLHRLIYIGGILAVLHIWSIGTHLEYIPIRYAALAALIVLSGLEMYRLSVLLRRKYSALTPAVNFYGLFLITWSLWIGAIMSIPIVIARYQDQHMHENHTPGMEHSSHE